MENDKFKCIRSQRNISCDFHKCKCGLRKSWSISDKELGIKREHGNGIVSAKNRAKGKYK